MSPRKPKAGTHRETSGAATGEPTTQDYGQLIASIDRVLRQFQTVQRETPEMFWWSIEVDADVTQHPDIALAAWAEVLQCGYDPDVLDLGGIGTEDLGRWTLYGVTGNGVTFDDYAKVADVCIAAVHALWLSAIVPMRRGAWDGLFVVTKDPVWARFHTVEKTSWGGSSVEEPGRAYRMLWACDRGDFAVSLGDFIDTYSIQCKARKGMSSAPVGGSYWTSIWFESLFHSAAAIGLTVAQGRKSSQYEEIAATDYRCVHESICEASILALQFLRQRAEERLRLLEHGRPVEEEVGSTRGETASGGKSRSKAKSGSIKDRFTFQRGRALFDGKDLDLPSGEPIPMLRQLVKHFDYVVQYTVFDPHYTSATPGTIHKSKREIVKSFKRCKVPYEITFKTGEGYLISECKPAARRKKRVRRK